MPDETTDAAATEKDVADNPGKDAPAPVTFPRGVPQLIKAGANQLARAWEADQSRTAALKELAATVVKIRAKFTDPKTDTSDWAGKTAEYRAAISKLYADSGVPADSISSFQSNLRYHIGNALRDKLTEDELAKAGLGKESPREAQQRRQSGGASRTNNRAEAKAEAEPAKLPDDPHKLVEGAIVLVRRAKGNPQPSDPATLVRLLETLEQEVMDYRRTFTAAGPEPVVPGDIAIDLREGVAA